MQVMGVRLRHDTSNMQYLVESSLLQRVFKLGRSNERFCRDENSDLVPASVLISYQDWILEKQKKKVKKTSTHASPETVFDEAAFLRAEKMSEEVLCITDNDLCQETWYTATTFVIGKFYEPVFRSNIEKFHKFMCFCAECTFSCWHSSQPTHLYCVRAFHCEATNKALQSEG